MASAVAYASGSFAQNSSFGMHLLDLTLPTLALNLALDEALLLDAEAGGAEVLRFWEWTAPHPESSPQGGEGVQGTPHAESSPQRGEGLAVVLGAGGKRAEEANVAACERDGIPILRRSSGGGAVLLGPGCLLFSLVLAYERHPALADLHASYRFILQTLADALAPLAPGIAPAGISDLAIRGKKCSGNSQQRKRSHLLHHGTLLCSFDLEQIPRYLAHPPREPEYRGQRAHLDFVTNLGVPSEQVKHCLRTAWRADGVVSAWPQETVRRLMVERYARADWHLRR